MTFGELDTGTIFRDGTPSMKRFLYVKVEVFEKHGMEYNAYNIRTEQPCFLIDEFEVIILDTEFNNTMISHGDIVYNPSPIVHVYPSNAVGN
jgi:hypothetical protein